MYMFEIFYMSNVSLYWSSILPIFFKELLPWLSLGPTFKFEKKQINILRKKKFIGGAKTY